jgi:hypothetical protein
MVALLPQQQIGGTTVVGMTDQQQRVLNYLNKKVTIYLHI